MLPLVTLLFAGSAVVWSSVAVLALLLGGGDFATHFTAVGASVFVALFSALEAWDAWENYGQTEPYEVTA